MMLNTNRDVKGSEANGTSCRFRAVRLREGVTTADAQLLRIDGYWVRSYCVSQLESIIVYTEHTQKGLGTVCLFGCDRFHGDTMVRVIIQGKGSRPTGTGTDCTQSKMRPSVFS